MPWEQPKKLQKEKKKKKRLHTSYRSQCPLHYTLHVLMNHPLSPFQSVSVCTSPLKPPLWRVLMTSVLSNPVTWSQFSFTVPSFSIAEPSFPKYTVCESLAPVSCIFFCLSVHCLLILFACSFFSHFINIGGPQYLNNAFFCIHSCPS